MLRTITAGFAFMALTADAAAACPAGYGACMVAGGTTICATGTSGGPHVYCDLKNGPGGTTAGRLTAKTEIVAGGTLYFTIWGNDDHNNKFCCATYPVLDGTGTRRFLRVTGSQLKDTIDMCPSGAYVDTDTELIGWDGDDVISGSCAPGYSDLLAGGSGADFLWGKDGNDTLFGEAGADHLDGGAGNDFLYAYYDYDHSTASAEQLFGQAGNDELYGADGDDVMDGGDGTDLVYGYDGDDLLCGMNGPADELYGDEGNDQLYTDYWSGSADITDGGTDPGGGDSDTCNGYGDTYTNCETTNDISPGPECPTHIGPT